MTGTGEKAAVTVERISYRQCLTPVRAFYLDLAQWAIEDPGRWAAWVAPCPVGEEEINQRKAARHRKSRMDARTRERLPVLPVLVRTVNERRKNAAELLQAARQAQPGETFTAAGQTLTRSVTTHPASGKIWADDPATRQATRPRPGRRPRLLGLGDRRGSARSPASASRNSWRSATTAWSSTGCQPPANSSRCCRSSRRRPTPNGSWSSARNSPTCCRPSSAGSAATPERCPWSPPTTGTNACGRPGPAAVPAPFRHREPQDQRQHAPHHAQRRSGPHRPGRPRRRAARCTTRRTTSAGCSSPTPS